MGWLTLMYFAIVLFGNMSMLLATPIAMSFPTIQCHFIQFTVLPLQLIILFLQDLILLHNQPHFPIFIACLFSLTKVRSIDRRVFSIKFLLE